MCKQRCQLHVHAKAHTIRALVCTPQQEDQCDVTCAAAAAPTRHGVPCEKCGILNTTTPRLPRTPRLLPLPCSTPSRPTAVRTAAKQFTVCRNVKVGYSIPLAGPLKRSSKVIHTHSSCVAFRLLAFLFPLSIQNSLCMAWSPSRSGLVSPLFQINSSHGANPA